MADIGFIGLGNMGLPMALNLLKAGDTVRGFDLNAQALADFAQAGGIGCETADAAVRDVSTVITALPAARHVCDLYLGENGILAQARPGTLFIDCSTIDVETARKLHQAATSQGMAMLDSPMSGGVGGATAGSLTFMVGGEAEAFDAAMPVLEKMGKNIFHAGANGAGCAAKICNNMMLAIQMISVAEGFALAQKLGLDAQKLYEISSTATAQCWSLNKYCPAPGPVPEAPSNNGYAPGFAASLMLKDLRIAMEAAARSDASTPMGALATQLYTIMTHKKQPEMDFSGIIQLFEYNINV